MSDALPNHPEDRRSLPRILLVAAAIVIVVLVCAYLFVAYRMTRTVLDGPEVYDFGIVMLEPGTSQTLTADIELVNRSGRTNVLEHIRSSCGCMQVDAPLGPIEPGDSLVVNVRLTLEDTGREGAVVLMGFQGLGAQQIVVQAVGRSTQTLSTSSKTVFVGDDGKATVTFVARRYDIDPPPEAYWSSPAVEVTDATFQGWSQLSNLDESQGVPAVWEGEFEVHATPAAGQVLPMIIHVGPEQTLQIQLAHRSLRPSEPGDRRLPIDALPPRDDEDS
jgi:hypothetical protein